MRHLLFFVFVLTAGCSGSSSSVGSSSSSSSPSDGAALFDAPDGEATADSIYGVWGGSLQEGNVTFDTRWRFKETAITLATRCAFSDGREIETVGVTARARVDEKEITFLESKRDEKKIGDAFCRVDAQPKSFPSCDEKEGFERLCFRLEGTALTLYGNTSFEKLVLVKLSD